MEVSKSGSAQAMQQAQQVQAAQRAQEVRKVQAQEQNQAQENKPKENMARKPAYEQPRETVNNQGQRIGTRLNAVA